MTETEFSPEAIQDFARRHLGVFGFMARVVADRKMQSGIVVFGEHEVRMSMADYVRLHRWADVQTRFDF